MDEVLMHSNAGYSDTFKEIISSTSKEIVGIFDTGTSLILGPTAAVKALTVGITEYNGVYVLDSCDASKIPSLSFKIKGKEYVISGPDLVITVVRSIYSWSGFLLAYLSCCYFLTNLSPLMHSLVRLLCEIEIICWYESVYIGNPGYGPCFKVKRYIGVAFGRCVPPQVLHCF